MAAQAQQKVLRDSAFAVDGALEGLAFLFDELRQLLDPLLEREVPVVGQNIRIRKDSIVDLKFASIRNLIRTDFLISLDDVIS